VANAAELALESNPVGVIRLAKPRVERGAALRVCVMVIVLNTGQNAATTAPKQTSATHREVAKAVVIPSTDGVDEAGRVDVSHYCCELLLGRRVKLAPSFIVNDLDTKSAHWFVLRGCARPAQPTHVTIDG
jgi:hypothetical protein